MKKEIGMIGMGRMGLNMATLLVEKGYRVVTTNRRPETTAAAEAVGIEVVADYAELKATLSPERLVWLMVPSKTVDAVLAEIIPYLDAGDTIIDGGNSFYLESLRRHEEITAQGFNYIDCGVSGGMEGARNGASVMVGAKQDIYDRYQELFKDLAAPNGYARAGGPGAGHFIKMVHNGIEYGMMGAIAEGINVLHEHEEKFGLDLKEIFKPYEHESIITSKLVTWLRRAYDEGQIEEIAGVVPVGETEFEMEHILTIGDTKVLAAALEQRKETREKPSYIGKLVAAMRNQFGGHKTVKPE